MALNSRLVFNETYYLAQNPDVKNAIGKVLDAAGTKFTSGLDHFTRAGAAEGRVATPLFNVDAYKANNPDLAEAGITTDAALRAHFYAYGAAEGRIALSTQVFNLDYYKANNQDLVDAGLTDAQIVRHFYEYGAAEGRQATVNFSVAAYKAANSDLAGLSDSVARAHWYTYGAGEGRAFPQLAQSFSVDPAAITVTEGNALTFTVTAALPVTAATSFTFNVTGDTNGGTLGAASATDFVGVTGTVTIAAGSSTGTFTITPTNDNTVEGLEGFKVSLFNSALAVVATSKVVAIQDGVSNQTLTLAATADSLTGGAGNDVFVANVVADNSSGTTLGAGDILTGGDGTDTLQVSVSGAATGAVSVTAVTLSGIENIVVDNFETSNNDNTFDLSLATGVTSIALRSSVATGDTAFTGVRALAAASMSNGSGDLSITYTSDVATSSTQTLALSGVTGGTFTATRAGTLAITSNGTSTNTVTVGGTAQSTVTATGTAGLTLGTVPSGVTKLDASALTGALSATFDVGTPDITVTGGAGNDVITISNASSIGTKDSLNGGAGTNTLAIATNLSTDAKTQVSNFQTLRLTATGTYDVDRLVGATSYDIRGSAGSTTLQGLVSGASVRVGADVGAANATTLTVTNATAVSSTADVLNISLQNGTSNTSLNAGTIAAAGVETINLTSSSGTGTNTVAAFTGSTGLTKLTATGSSALTLTSTGALAISTIDASAMTGGLTITTNASTASGVMTVTGGSGNDNLAGRSGRDSIVSGAGNDTITGGGGNDFLSGGDGNDDITGGANDDTIVGGAGNDTVTSGAGTDSVDAGEGDDTVTISTTNDFASTDTIIGGAGNDTLNFTQAGTVDLTAPLLLSNVSGFEVINLGAGGAQTLTINDAVITNNTVTITSSTAQAHTITATGVLSSNSTVNFTDTAGGDQTYSVGNGKDNVSLGAGADTVTISTVGYLTSNDSLAGGAGADTLFFTDAAGLSHLNMTTAGHALTNATGFETISINSTNNAAGDYRFTLSDAFVAGNANSTTSQFTVSRDSLDTGGTTRVDGSAVSSSYKLILTGAGGADTLVGGAGDDTITGGGGNDTITLGTGSDVFVVTGSSQSNNGTDSITDFNFGTSTTTVDQLQFDLTSTTKVFGTASGGITAAAGTEILVLNTTTYTDASGAQAAARTAFGANDNAAEAIVIWQDTLGNLFVSTYADATADATANGTLQTQMIQLVGLSLNANGGQIDAGDFSII